MSYSFDAFLYSHIPDVLGEKEHLTLKKTTCCCNKTWSAFQCLLSLLITALFFCLAVPFSPSQVPLFNTESPSCAFVLCLYFLSSSFSFFFLGCDFLALELAWLILTSF